MIDRICLLLEALSVVICLHHLYGEKFRLDIKTVGFLAVDMIIMEFINFYGMPSTYTLLIYPIIFIYCGIKFRFEIKSLFINSILYLAIVGVVQLLVMMSCYYFFDMNYVDSIALLIANIIVLLIVAFILPILKIYKISAYLQRKERIYVISLIICIIITLRYVINFKIFERLDIKRYVLLFVSLALICALIVQIGNLRLKSKQMRIELKMHELYSKSFEGLITDIRVRQHEFDNHISTIYSQHLLCDTYDGLVEMQRDYCKNLEKENRYNKLLKYDNHIIRGFLYVKFLEVEKQGIEVSYEVVVDKLAVKMPVYKLVEILGDLINNAVEAMAEAENVKKMHVSIIEVEKKVEIEVRNTSRYISHDEISRFFEKGYSKKGTNRGLGLYNVKKICEEYGFKVACENKEIDDLDWLSFKIVSEGKKRVKI